MVKSMPINLAQIRSDIQTILPEIKKIRHHLHAFPELSLKEFQTSQFIRQQLRSTSVKLFDPFLATDVVGLLWGKSPGKNVTLRADIDALPLAEKKDSAYRSTVKNIQHACGHDGHTAMLLGAAKILEKHKELFSGSVRFVFQPGEEVVAAGRDLVAKGILSNPQPQAVLALHIWPGIPVGTICSKLGVMMAASDLFRLVIHGKGGHGSKPEQAIDPIFIASRLINSLYHIPSRKLRALDAVVFSVCRIQGGYYANVIPDEVEVEGTVRYLSKAVAEKIPAIFETTVKNECAACGATYTLDYARPYPLTVNDRQIVTSCKAVAKNSIGKSRWRDLEEPTMGSEDFSYYLDQNPGAMFFLGNGEDSPPLHSPYFDFNDEALFNGMLFVVLSTLTLLGAGKNIEKGA